MAIKGKAAALVVPVSSSMLSGALCDDGFFCLLLHQKVYCAYISRIKEKNKNNNDNNNQISG